LWKAAKEGGRWAGIFENLNNLQFFQILEIKEPSALLTQTIACDQSFSFDGSLQISRSC
jgi:hypothetical protein